jgi:AraC-like DNA-binding protein
MLSSINHEHLEAVSTSMIIVHFIRTRLNGGTLVCRKNVVRILLIFGLVFLCNSYRLYAASGEILLTDWQIDIGSGFKPCKAVPWNYPQEKGGLGSDFTGYALYQTSVTIPSQFKLRQIAIFFQGIDDVDITYMNGERVGASGAFPVSEHSDKGYLSAWRSPRLYPIPESIIKYDELNTITVKVFSPSGQGGLVGRIPKIGMYDSLLKQVETCTVLNNIPRIAVILVFFVLGLILLRSVITHSGDLSFRSVSISLINTFNPVLFVLRSLAKKESTQCYTKTAVTKYISLTFALVCFLAFILHELTYDIGIFVILNYYMTMYSIFIFYIGIVLILSVAHSLGFSPDNDMKEGGINYISLVLGTLVHPGMVLLYFSPILVASPGSRYNDFTTRGSFITIIVVAILLVAIVRKHIINILRDSREHGLQLRITFIINAFFLIGSFLTLIFFITAPSWLYMHSMTIAGVLICMYILSTYRSEEHMIRMYARLRIQNKNNDPGYSVKNKLKNVVEFIRDNYSDDISRDNIAFAIGVSPEYLSRIFNSQMKMTIIEYITETRINAATLLLESTDKTIIEIAFSSGFNSLRTFNRAFLRRNKISPTQYRFQYRKASIPAQE